MKEPLLAQAFGDGDNIGQTVLHVPMVHTWSDGLWITDDQGTHHKYQILRVDRLGYQTPDNPTFRVIIGDEHGQVVAAVQRKMKNMGTTDSYVIYTTKPNWPGQLPENRLVRASFPLCSVTVGPFGGQYTIKAWNGKVLMKAKMRCFPWALLCLTSCLMMGCFRWNLQFHEPHEHEQLITRDQGAGLVTVREGTSPLLGLCVAFAVDHLTRPSC